ncbi:MAG: pyridoxamine 5'-phosphate oxidase family protein [Deltaproteobacteria bacterium]|nr:pyridoxamine 5'-phosphate oxidase family protein [Deltaproteobacteria bacterium]
MERVETNYGSEKEYDEKLEEDFVENLKIEKKKLTRDELKKKIVEFLAGNKICTLATCLNNIPRSTPLRYRSKDLTIYILTEGGMKVKNIRENPAVSVSLYGDYSGFQSVKGLQIWGKAEIIDPEEGDKYRKARKLINVEEREDLKKLGIKDVRPDMKIIKIETERARFLSFPEGILNQILTVSDK